jgi:hypothetical protein
MLDLVAEKKSKVMSKVHRHHVRRRSVLLPDDVEMSRQLAWAMNHRQV